MKNEIITYLDSVLTTLENSRGGTKGSLEATKGCGSEFAAAFVAFKIDFFKKYHGGRILSSEFGVNFFGEVRDWILRKDYPSQKIDNKSEFRR